MKIRFLIGTAVNQDRYPWIPGQICEFARRPGSHEKNMAQVIAGDKCHKAGIGLSARLG